MAHYVKRFTKHAHEDYLAELDAHTPNELANTFQRSSCRLFVPSTTFKSGVSNYDKRLKTKNQSLRRKLEHEKEQLAKLQAEISAFENKAAMADSKLF